MGTPRECSKLGAELGIHDAEFIVGLSLLGTVSGLAWLIMYAMLLLQGNFDFWGLILNATVRCANRL